MTSGVASGVTLGVASLTQALHGGRPPKNTSKVSSAAISRQKGQMAMMASQSSVHLHRLASFTAHPQHTA